MQAGAHRRLRQSCGLTVSCSRINLTAKRDCYSPTSTLLPPHASSQCATDLSRNFLCSFISTPQKLASDRRRNEKLIITISVEQVSFAVRILADFPTLRSRPGSSVVVCGTL